MIKRDLCRLAFILTALASAAGCTREAEQDDTIDLAIEPYIVPSGAEVQRCQEMTLPADTDVDIDQIAWDFSQGSHHLHVYVSADGGTGAPDRTYDCFQAVDFEKWHLLIATQDGSLDWTLPEGTAFHVKAHQSILIQTHYLNTSALATEGSIAQGTVSFHVAAPGSVEKRAAAIFGQNRTIAVPAHASAHFEAECALPSAGEIIAMTGHYHTHGKKFQTWLEPEGKEPRTIYESKDFAEPVWKTYDALHLGARDRFGWACDYDNNLEIPLEFGPREDTQEHCNLFAFYTLDRGDADFLPCVIKAPEAQEPAARPIDLMPRYDGECQPAVMSPEAP